MEFQTKIFGALAVGSLVVGSLATGPAFASSPSKRAPEKVNQVASLAVDLDVVGSVLWDDDASMDTPDVLTEESVTGSVVFTLIDNTMGAIKMVNFMLPSGATWDSAMLDMTEGSYDNISTTCSGTAAADISLDGRTLTVQYIHCDVIGATVTLDALATSTIEYVVEGDNNHSIVSAYRTEKSRKKLTPDVKSWVISSEGLEVSDPTV